VLGSRLVVHQGYALWSLSAQKVAECRDVFIYVCLGMNASTGMEWDV
jgi:hypothetical protein